MLNRKKFLQLISSNTAAHLLLSRLPFGALTLSDLNLNTNSHLLPGNDDLSADFFDAVKGYKIILRDKDDQLLVMAYQLTKSMLNSLPKDRNIAIFCYKCSFQDSSTVKLNGKHLYLLTANIDFNGVTINTQPDQAPQANPIQKNGLEGVIPDRNEHHAPAGDDLAIDARGNRNDNLINGKDGGDIILHCLASTGSFRVNTSGGKGGKGQRGANGRNGAEFMDVNSIPTAGHIGESVSIKGEIGGDGSIGGFGGNAGSLQINIPNREAFKGGVYAGGYQGDSGEPGVSGVEGDRVRRVQSGTRTYVSAGSVRNGGGGGREVPVYSDTRISGSQRNVEGKKPEVSGTRNGKPGQLQMAAENDFYKYIPIEFARLLLLKAEALYLDSAFTKNNININEAYKLLAFIYKISENNPGWGFPSSTPSPDPFIDFGASGHNFVSEKLWYLNASVQDKGQWESIHQKCSSYLNQIQLNLDFFGNPPNYAPNLAYDFLADNFRQNIPLISGIEDFAKRISAEQRGFKKEMLLAEKYIQQCNRNIETLDADIESLKRSIIDLNQEIQDRFAVLEKLKSVLAADQADLQRAIDDMNGCSFGTILKCLAAVVAVAAAVVSCGAGTVAAIAAVGSVASSLQTIESFKELKDAISDEKSMLRKGVDNVSNNLDKVSGSINKAVDNAQIIGDAFRKKNTPGASVPDFVIAVDTEKFDETIDKIIDNPNLSDEAKAKAGKYRADYHYFVDYIMVTNQKRLEITANVLKINQDYHERESQKQQIDRYNETKLTNALALTVTDKLDIFDIYYKIKGHVSYFVYLQNKALAYQYPKDYGTAEGVYDQLSIEYLNQSAFKTNWKNIYLFNQSAISIRNPRNTVRPLVIKFGDFDASQSVSNDIAPLCHQNFLVPTKDSRGNSIFSCQFKIEPTNANHSFVFLNSYNIKVSGIIAVFNGKQQTFKNLTYTLTHFGNSIATKDSNLNTVQFFQDVRVNQLYCDVINKEYDTPSFERALADGTDPKFNLVDKTPSGHFAQLGRSPFASWKLDISTKDNPITEAKLKDLIADLQSIDLYFYYTYQQSS